MIDEYYLNDDSLNDSYIEQEKVIVPEETKRTKFRKERDFARHHWRLFPNCPTCGGKLKPSKLEPDKALCKQCNDIHTASSM